MRSLFRAQPSRPGTPWFLVGAFALLVGLGWGISAGPNGLSADVSRSGPAAREPLDIRPFDR